MLQHKRIAIAGGPRTGKTTLAKLFDDREKLSTDDLMDLPWGDVPQEIIKKLEKSGSFVVEGVQVPRALRKGLKVDCVVWLDQPKVAQTPKQASMSKAVKTVFDEWRGGDSETPVETPAPETIAET